MSDTAILLVVSVSCRLRSFWFAPFQTGAGSYRLEQPAATTKVGASPRRVRSCESACPRVAD